MENTIQSKTKYLNVILISIAFVIFIFGAYYLGKQSSDFHGGPLRCADIVKTCPDGSIVNADNLSCEYPSCPIPNTPSTTPIIPTPNLKVYRNSQYSFVFKYPVDLKLSSDPQFPDNYTLKNSSTFISFNIQSTCLNTQCLSTQSLDEIAKNMLGLDVLSSFKIGNSKGIKITNGFMVEIPNSNNFLLLNSGQNTPIVDQILSTFKFGTLTSQPSCGSCPQFSPPAPNFCTDGVIKSGGRNSCGCNLPPDCVR